MSDLDLPEGLRVRFQTLELRGMDVHIRSLRDRNQYADASGEAEAANVSSASWPLFGLLWDCGLVLADLMTDYPVEGLRILEVGCGLAVSSIVLSLRGADITATDHNPASGDFLRANVAINGGRPIPFVRADWTDPDCGMGTFDLIIGSEILYEPDHAGALAGFVERHAKPHGQVIIVDPRRGHVGRFVKHMRADGWRADRRDAPASDLIEGRRPGEIIVLDR